MFGAERWLDKYRGYVYPVMALVLNMSSSDLLPELFKPEPKADPKGPGGGKGKKVTVGGAFRASLKALTATLLPGTAARDPSKARSQAAPDSRLPPTQCSLMSGCAVDKRRRRVV